MEWLALLHTDFKFGSNRHHTAPPSFAPYSTGAKSMKSLRLLLRFLTIGGLVLLLLIPLLMIRGTINDRERYRAQAVERVSQSMAGPQQVVGPLRGVPW